MTGILKWREYIKAGGSVAAFAFGVWGMTPDNGGKKGAEKAIQEGSETLARNIEGHVAQQTEKAAAKRIAQSTGKIGAECAEQPIYVIGRQVDTAVAKNWPGHEILDIPNWSLEKNRAWVQNIIDKRATVYIGTPQNKATLFDVRTNRPTVFAQELEQLRKAGYTQVGDYMCPPIIK